MVRAPKEGVFRLKQSFRSLDAQARNHAIGRRDGVRRNTPSPDFAPQYAGPVGCRLLSVGCILARSAPQGNGAARELSRAREVAAGAVHFHICNWSEGTPRDRLGVAKEANCY